MPPEVLKDIRDYGADDDEKDKFKHVFKICQKLSKDRSYHEKRKVCSYLKEKVHFFKSLEKEKLEILAVHITAKEYEPGDVSK